MGLESQYIKGSSIHPFNRLVRFTLYYSIENLKMTEDSWSSLKNTKFYNTFLYWLSSILFPPVFHTYSFPKETTFSKLSSKALISGEIQDKRIAIKSSPRKQFLRISFWNWICFLSDSNSNPTGSVKWTGDNPPVYSIFRCRKILISVPAMRSSFLFLLITHSDCTLLLSSCINFLYTKLDLKPRLKQYVSHTTWNLCTGD